MSILDDNNGCFFFVILSVIRVNSCSNVGSKGEYFSIHLHGLGYIVRDLDFFACKDRAIFLILYMFASKDRGEDSQQTQLACAMENKNGKLAAISFLIRSRLHAAAEISTLHKR